MAIIDTVRYALTGRRSESRSVVSLPFDEWVQYFSFGSGLTFPFRQTINGNVEQIDESFSSLVQGAYKSNGIVFACNLARMSLFSQARIMYQQERSGTPGDLFSSPELDLLRHPWPGATTGDLLARAIVDVDLGGNAFFVRRPNRIRRLRPDWVDIMLGSESDPDVEAGDIDAEVLGYVYHPGGRYSGRDPELLLADQVAHFAPIPDPLATFRGMSWLTPIIREIQGDTAATAHKVQFFNNGATPNLVVTVDIDDPDKFTRWVEAFDTEHKGVANAYKTLYLMSGTEVNAVGKDFQQMDFKVTQGAGETRIASASGIHPVILGFSEGMQGASLNAGNFNSAKRLTADKTLRWLWQNFCGSMETIIPVPPAARLWYDERHIPFLQEDVKDAAEVLGLQATAIRTLGDGGWVPETVVDAVTSGDLKRLQHTQLLPVQLQTPGQNNTEPPVQPRSVALIDLQRRALLTGSLPAPQEEKRTP